MLSQSCKDGMGLRDVTSRRWGGAQWPACGVARDSGGAPGHGPERATLRPRRLPPRRGAARRRPPLPRSPLPVPTRLPLYSTTPPALPLRDTDPTNRATRAMDGRASASFRLLLYAHIHSFNSDARPFTHTFISITYLSTPKPHNTTNIVTRIDVISTPKFTITIKTFVTYNIGFNRLSVNTYLMTYLTNI